MSATLPARAEPATAVFSALGTTAVLLTADPARADDALLILRAELAAIDAACSRFRPDSELSRANATAGTGPVPVSALLAEAVEAALRAAELTDGAVDPTVGPAVVALGYDRTFAQVAARRPEDTAPSTGPADRATARRRLGDRLLGPGAATAAPSRRYDARPRRHGQGTGRGPGGPRGGCGGGLRCPGQPRRRPVGGGRTTGRRLAGRDRR